MSTPIPMASYTQPYDATSTSAAKVASPSPPEKFDEDISAARCQLFANSALEVQKEWTYMTERRFDLDGLDFDTAWHLLQLHWNHHHMAYLLSYRPALMHSLATGGPYINKLLLNAIYLASALNSDRKELYDDKSSIASAVGLLTVGSSLVSNGQQTAGWHYSGLGYRMMVDLGLHISPDQTRTSDPLNASQSQIEFTHVDMEMSRRVFWGAYINDKFQSLYFGRPPALVAIGIEPSRLLIDTYEELELWSPYVDSRASSPPLPPSFPQPAYTISTFSSLLELVDIMADIIEHFYTPKVHFLSKENTLREVKRVQSDLQSWEQRLPKHLLYHPKHDPVPPAHRFNPPMTFHMLHILLYRPFLAEGHLRHFELDENEPRAICTSAAFQIYELAKAYRQAFTFRRATYMFSYSLFSAASIIPLKSSGEQTAVDTMQKVIAAFFWTSLKELQNGANFGLRKPIMIIRSLFERAGLHSEPTTTHRNDIEHGVPSQERPLNQSCYTRVFENIDEQTLFQDLTSGSFDEVINMGDMVVDEDSHILYGLFR
ncbi:uncharacterized protein N7477_005260 [Penicillium maclennaniae]|uniref:uncharacterized protein n=1 Tax=Penicillium maclennaniae TaxID=1343394 RepID=UPI002541CB9B|nr:uncharacterized protein N7477_005260 [Penicillium maclennaniae]KAJ5669897.1 hypothetical protein N7477_005260 [Penicillium maclennaniae]